MQYKTSFFLTVLGQFFTSFSAFLVIYFMFARFNSVEGFTYSEVLLCFAVVLLSFSLAECFARGFDAFTPLSQTANSTVFWYGRAARCFRFLRQRSSFRVSDGSCRRFLYFVTRYRRAALCGQATKFSRLC